MTDARDLYGLPLERFVTERGALAKSLRAEGERGHAASVAGRRKPTVEAWAVNQLVRAQDRAISSLFQAGDALLQAQAALLAGRGDAHVLREAAERERAAVDELVNVSRGLLSANGYELTQATLDRVSATLHAAAIAGDAREQVRNGCLERELRYVGFGTTEATSAPAQRTAAKPSPAQTRVGAKRKAKGRVQAQARKAQAEARKVQADARKAEADSRALAERAAFELQAAQVRRDHVATELGVVQEALVQARQRAEEAASAHRVTRQALEGADRQ